MDPASDELNILLPALAALIFVSGLSLSLVLSAYALQYRVIELRVSTVAVRCMKATGFGLGGLVAIAWLLVVVSAFAF